jgi:hypothetical protein
LDAETAFRAQTPIWQAAIISNETAIGLSKRSIAAPHPVALPHGGATHFFPFTDARPSFPLPFIPHSHLKLGRRAA